MKKLNEKEKVNLWFSKREAEKGTVSHDASLTRRRMKLVKSFCGVQGRFFQKKPLVAEGKSNFMTATHEAATSPGDA